MKAIAPAACYSIAVPSYMFKVLVSSVKMTFSPWHIFGQL